MLCSNVEHNLSWRFDGLVSPCNNMQGFPAFATVEQLRNSAEYQALLDDHRSGKQSNYCQTCWNKEALALTSKRQSDNLVGEVYQAIEPNYLKVDAAIGDVCNAACRTCGPTSSTLWQQEQGIIPIKPEKVEVFWKVIDNNLDCVLQLDFGGGEPWLNDIDQQIDLCQRLIDQGRAKHVKLRYNTNCSLYPKKLIDFFPYFRSVELTLSIDGTEEQFEYARYPLKWTKAYENVQRLIELEQAHKNIVLTVNYTVSVLTFLYAEKFLEWSRGVGLPRVNWNFVYHPAVYSITSMDQEAKTKLPESAMFYDLIATKNVPNWRQDFLELTDKLDKQRKQSLKQSLPELYYFLNKGN